MFDTEISVMNNSGYEPREFTKRAIVDDCYVFDISRGYTIISCRAKNNLMKNGDCIFDIFGVDEAEAIRNAANSFSKENLIISTILGAAIVVTRLIPSSHIGLMIFPHAEHDVVINLGAAGVVGNYVIPEIYPRLSKMRKKEKDFFLDFCRLTGDIIDCFTLEPIKNDEDFSYYRALLTHKLQSLSYFMGCPLEIEFRHKIHLTEKFDYPMCIAATLLLLLLCRKNSTTRSAKAVISKFKNDMSMLIEFTTSVSNLSASSEIETIQNVADRLNLVHDFYQSPTHFRFRLCPIREDWSRLEIKGPQTFKWDR